MENIVLEKINYVNGKDKGPAIRAENLNQTQQYTQNAFDKITPIITDIENNTTENTTDLIATKQFIENSMKTMEEEGTSIHVSDSADYSCKLEIEGKSEQVQTEQGKNLLPFKDINFTLKGVNFYTENGNLYLNGASTGEILTNDNAYITYFSFILPVGTYKFKHFSSLNVNMAIQLKNVSDKSELASINLNSNTVKTFTLDKETEVYLGIYIYNQNFNSENLKLMLSIEDATEYEPFVPDSPSPNYPSKIENVSGDLEVKVLGKNLFNYNSEVTNFGSTYATREKITNGYKMTATITGGAQRCQLIIPMEILTVGKKYTLSYKSDFNPTQIRVGDADSVSDTNGYDKYGNFKNVTTGKITFTLTEKSKKYLIFALYNANAQTGDTYSIWDIQVEYSETATEFEEYKEQKVTFPLGEQKLMKEGYFASNGIHNKRKQVILDENITVNKGSVFEIFVEGGLVWGESVISNYFKYPGIRLGNNGRVWIYYSEKYYSEFANYTATEFKNWLAEKYNSGNPVVIEYPLAEEETTPYTEEQATAKKQIDALKTYRTVTNISNNQNTNMQLTYKKDLQTQFQELETMLLESGV